MSVQKLPTVVYIDVGTTSEPACQVGVAAEKSRALEESLGKNCMGLQLI